MAEEIYLKNGKQQQPEGCLRRSALVRVGIGSEEGFAPQMLIELEP